MNYPNSKTAPECSSSLYINLDNVSHVDMLIKNYDNRLDLINSDIISYEHKCNYAMVKCLKAIKSEFLYFLLNLNEIKAKFNT